MLWTANPTQPTEGAMTQITYDSWACRKYALRVDLAKHYRDTGKIERARCQAALARELLKEMHDRGLAQ